MIATPRLVRRDFVIGDELLWQRIENCARFSFVRAVANIDTNVFRVRAGLALLGEGLDHCSQRRQDAIERFWKTNSFPPRP